MRGSGVRRERRRAAHRPEPGRRARSQAARRATGSSRKASCSPIEGSARRSRRGWRRRSGWAISPSCIRKPVGPRCSTTAMRPASSSGASRPRAWSCASRLRRRFGDSLTHLLEPRLGYALVTKVGQSGNPLFVPRAAVEQQRLRELDLENVTRDPADRVPEFNGVTAAVANRFWGRLGEQSAPRFLGDATLSAQYDFADDDFGLVAARRARVSASSAPRCATTLGFDPRAGADRRDPARGRAGVPGGTPRRPALPLSARHPALLRGLSLRARALPIT